MTVPWVPDTICETHEWRSSQGEVIRFVTRTQAKERFMPPVTLETIRVPQAQGARFRGARHEARLATIPVVVPGPDAGRQELRRWARALDPLKGEGTLTVVQGAFAGRQLVCAYEAGLESWSEDFPLLGLTTLAFRAADPYWQDANASTVTSGTNPNSFTWFPFFPLILGDDRNVFVSYTVTNAGDVDAWPVVEVTGPGAGLRIENTTTGEHLEITQNIPAAAKLTIDTRPGHKTVSMGGTNGFSWLTADSSLWPLVPGANRITVLMTGATPASRVSFTWRNRWLAA